MAASALAGDKWARLFGTFRRVHRTRPEGLGLRPFIAARAAGFLGRQARLFRSWVVARGLSRSVARTHAAPRALLFHAEDMRMPDPEHGINNSDFIDEVLAAWIVTLLVVAIGVLLLALHEPGIDDRRVPRWYEPPVADAGEWADDLLVRRGADLMPRSASSSTPDTPSKHR
jgi:hypothetical protein